MQIASEEFNRADLAEISAVGCSVAGRATSGLPQVEPVTQISRTAFPAAL